MYLPCFFFMLSMHGKCMVVLHFFLKICYFINVLNLIRKYVAKKICHQHKALPTWPYVAWFHSVCCRIDIEPCLISRTEWQVQNFYFLSGRLPVRKSTYFLPLELVSYHVWVHLWISHTPVWSGRPTGANFYNPQGSQGTSWSNRF